jgi:VanZ family protein
LHAMGVAVDASMKSIPFDHPFGTRAWRFVLLLLLCAITWLALSPAPPPQANLGWDKLNHGVAFATLSLVAVLGRCGTFRLIGSALLAYGGLIEVLQAYTPTRVGEWPDWLADGVGITAGLLLTTALRRLRALLA